MQWNLNFWFFWHWLFLQWTLQLSPSIFYVSCRKPAGATMVALFFDHRFLPEIFSMGETETDFIGVSCKTDAIFAHASLKVRDDDFQWNYSLPTVGSAPSAWERGILRIKDLPCWATRAGKAFLTQHISNTSLWTLATSGGLIGLCWNGRSARLKRSISNVAEVLS